MIVKLVKRCGISPFHGYDDLLRLAWLEREARHRADVEWLMTVRGYGFARPRTAVFFARVCRRLERHRPVAWRHVRKPLWIWLAFSIADLGEWLQRRGRPTVKLGRWLVRTSLGVR